MKQILVVDDEKYIRRGLKSMIEHSAPPQTLEVQVARDGQEAYDMLVQKDFDVLFTDINMPRMNGIELIRSIREAKLDLVIIIISGYNDFHYAVEGMRNGVVDYLLNSITRDNVKKIIQRYVLETHLSQQDYLYSRDLLIRDIRCALLAPHVTSEDTAEIKQRLLKILKKDSCMIICMSRQVNHQGSRFAGHEGGSLYVSDIADRHYLFTTETREEQLVVLPPFSGMAMLQAEDSFLQVCRQAEDAMKRAFFCGANRLIWDGHMAANKPTLSEITKLVHYVDEGRIAELQQFLESKIAEYTPEYLERLFRAMLDMLAEYYPTFITNHNSIDKGLQNPYQFPSLRAYLGEMYGYLYVLSRDLKTSSKTQADHQIEIATNYIHKNYQNDISLATVAAYIDHNYSALSREFKKITGTSFVNYLKNVRIKRACELLHGSEGKIADISERVGFYNERYFTKMFKESMGITPSEYRALHQHRVHQINDECL